MQTHRYATIVLQYNLNYSCSAKVVGVMNDQKNSILPVPLVIYHDNIK